MRGRTIEGGKPRPNRRDLAVVIGRLQDLIGCAKSFHDNDREPDGFEIGQKLLQEAFELCIEALCYDPPRPPRGPWAEGRRTKIP